MSLFYGLTAYSITNGSFRKEGLRFYDIGPSILNSESMKTIGKYILNLQRKGCETYKTPCPIGFYINDEIHTALIYTQAELNALESYIWKYKNITARINPPSAKTTHFYMAMEELPQTVYFSDEEVAVLNSFEARKIPMQYDPFNPQIGSRYWALDFTVDNQGNRVPVIEPGHPLRLQEGSNIAYALVRKYASNPRASKLQGKDKEGRICTLTFNGIDDGKMQLINALSVSFSFDGLMASDDVVLDYYNHRKDNSQLNAVCEQPQHVLPGEPIGCKVGQAIFSQISDWQHYFSVGKVHNLVVDLETMTPVKFEWKFSTAAVRDAIGVRSSRTCYFGI